MTDERPTVRALALGQAITDAIRRKSWTATTLVDALGWSHSKVSRIATGARLTKPRDVIAILAALGVVGPERDELIDFADNLHQISWWQEHNQRSSAHLDILHRIELAATTITTYSGDLVPPPLQTRDYLRLLAHDHPAQERDDYVTARLKAQQQLLDNAPHLSVFIDEHALTHTGIPFDTMSDQVHHLLRLAIRPEITIRVIPETTGLRRHGPFSLMTFTKHPPLVYLEHLNTSAYLEHPHTITGYRDTITDLTRTALNEQETQTRLRQLAAYFSEPIEKTERDIYQ